MKKIKGANFLNPTGHKHNNALPSRSKKMLLLLVHGTQCFYRGLRVCSVRTFLCRSSRITYRSLLKYTRDFSGKNNYTILNQVTQTAQSHGHQAADSRAS